MKTKWRKCSNRLKLIAVPNPINGDWPNFWIPSPPHRYWPSVQFLWMWYLRITWREFLKMLYIYFIHMVSIISTIIPWIFYGTPSLASLSVALNVKVIFETCSSNYVFPLEWYSETSIKSNEAFSSLLGWFHFPRFSNYINIGVFMSFRIKSLSKFMWPKVLFK